jgi:thiamine biosynthesis lipoprotein
MTSDRCVRVEPLMGTVVTVDVRGRPVAAAAVEAAIAAFFEQLRATEQVFSPWRPDSEISRISDGRLDVADAGPDVRFVLSACEHLKTVSGGAFDIRGTRSDGRLDPSGFVKGWSVEEAARHLDEAGLRDYGINAGGDILVRGDSEPGTGTGWRVGIRDPDDAARVVRVLRVRGQAVATSGLYERGAHIRDPRRGSIAPGPGQSALTSLTVVGPSFGWADAYSTAGFVMGDGALDWIDGLAGYGALAIDAERRLAWTARLDPMLAPIEATNSHEALTSRPSHDRREHRADPHRRRAGSSSPAR